MSYDPQSGGSNQPPDESQGGYRASEGSPTSPTGGATGGGPTQPVGGYTPPPAGGYTPPPEPAGGYTPPSGGGPTQPVGGYTPPPSGGYTPPPPPPGGYTPPPPPPPTGPVSRPEGAGGFDFQSMFQSWMNALTKPNVMTYEGEIPRANWTTTLVGVAIVAILRALVALLAAGTAAATIDQFRNFFPADSNFDPSAYAWAYGGAGGAGAVGTFIFTFISFFLGAGVLWLAARMLGGTGSDFMTHSYLLSLSYTPIRAIAAVLNIIPFLGGIVGFVLFFYQLYLAGLSMQASQRMQPGRAQMAAFLPTIIGVVLGGLCCLLFAGLIAAALSGIGNQ
jgi:hypothetical protein